MVLTVTEDTPADMLAGSMELVVQLPRDRHPHTQRVTVLRSTPMMDLLVQIATANKLTASCYVLQAVGERGLVLPHQPNTPIGALDALQVNLLPKQGTTMQRKTKPANQPFETTFRLQVHLPRNQLYVSRVSPKMNLGEILVEVCREKNLDIKKYELRHPANLEEVLDLRLSLQDYSLQEVTLYTKQNNRRCIGSELSSQDIMALQRQEDRRRQQAKQNAYEFSSKKSPTESFSNDSLERRSNSPARSDETARSASPAVVAPPRPARKRRPAPKPPVPLPAANPGKIIEKETTTTTSAACKEKTLVGHSRNSSDSSGYHEASVLSDNPESSGRMPETLPRRSKPMGAVDAPRKLAQTSRNSKSLGNLSGPHGELRRAISNASLSAGGYRKKRVAPPPPVPEQTAIISMNQCNLKNAGDSEESLTSDMEHSKPSSIIGTSSKANSDIDMGEEHKTMMNLPRADFELNRKSVVDAQRDRRPTADDEKTPIVVARPVDESQSSASLATRELDPVPVPRNAAIVNSSDSTDKTEQQQTVVRRTTDTDILLRKVSDTLSNSLKPELRAATNKTEELSGQENGSVRSEEAPVDEISAQTSDKGNASPTAFNVTGTTNTTINSSLHQDTSDYVSATEDLSLSEWEYQLPKPPSAFRDSNASESDVCDATALPSVSTAEQMMINGSEEEVAKEIKPLSPKTIEVIVKEEPKKEDKSTTKVTKADRKSKVEIKLLKDENTSNLRKEVISELTGKIENQTLSRANSKDGESKRAMDNVSTPKIAPVVNTLSNFTITTYSREKPLNIFDEDSQRTTSSNAGQIAEETRRFNNVTRTPITRSQSIGREESNRQNIVESNGGISITLRGNEEANGKLRRTQTYLSTTYNQPKNSTWVNESKEKCVMNGKSNQNSSNKSAANAESDVPRANEKFARWRENILKKQENTSEEKQLQSLQVLKSILPQLNNQQAVKSEPSESYNARPSFNKQTSCPKPSVQTLQGNVPTSTNGDEVTLRNPNRVKFESVESRAKRYTYSGPPTVTLGSWSERPRVNVQIKTDTDYKFGKVNSTNGKTVVSLNGNGNVEGKRTSSVIVNEAPPPAKIVEKKGPPTIVNMNIPKPPPLACNAVPVITGVTLKNHRNNNVNSRPKSMPPQVDLRGQLLESIRNFGGREKLQRAAERY